MGGEWDGPKPVCFGLNQENDYSMEKPPTILFRHHSGPIGIIQGGSVLNVNNSPIDSSSKNKLTYIMSFS